MMETGWTTSRRAGAHADTGDCRVCHCSSDDDIPTPPFLPPSLPPSLPPFSLPPSFLSSLPLLPSLLPSLPLFPHSPPLSSPLPPSSLTLLPPPPLQRSGNVYEGEWHHNKRHGRGTMHWYDRGESYTGQWVNGIQQGHGEHIWLIKDTDHAQVSIRLIRRPLVSFQDLSSHPETSHLIPRPLASFQDLSPHSENFRRYISHLGSPHGYGENYSYSRK